MKRVAIALVLCVIAGAARASPVTHMGGGGPPNVIQGGLDAIWSEPPDLNGLIGSSEQILTFGLETELANDFVPDVSEVSPTWWGGFYNTASPCESGMTTPGFNLKFYDDAGCVPGNLIAYIVDMGVSEESVGCQAGTYPMFRWTSYSSAVVTQGNIYWFGAQMMDHAFPPQAGRLAAAFVTGCDTVFQSVYFGFPDWTPAIDVFGVAFDCSQEFQWAIFPPPVDGACCIGDQCSIVEADYCAAHGGRYLGDNVSCNPNPCESVPTKSTSWGRIKESYR
jgi:hypothetical protein